MRSQRWALALLLAVGVLLGVAIGGVPSRHSDPPLRVTSDAVTTTTTSTTLPPTTTTTSPPATEAPTTVTPTTRTTSRTN